MPTLTINTPGTKIRLDAGRLTILRPDPETPSARPLVRHIPLIEIDRVNTIDSVSLSGKALSALLQRGIPVSVFNSLGRHLGAFQPAESAHGAWRLLHYRRAQDPEFALLLARRIISAKIYNQRRVIQRLALNRKLNRKEAVDFLGALLTEAGKSPSLDHLRGLEGAASARYFRAWSDFLPAQFPFQRRSTRPPLNPPNACLSFGSVILYQETLSAIHAVGLDPALGLLHTTENGRWSLALDLMEPFRPVLIEALTLDAFTHRTFHEADFEPAKGGIHLTREARAKFLFQYERRMDRDFLSESAGHRTSLRQQLENQAVMFKSALQNPDAFEPFLMN